MENKELTHHGILGQKWGKKNGPPYPLSQSKRKSIPKENSNKNKENVEDKKTAHTQTRSVKDMSDDDLRKAVSRLELERRYSDLSKPQNTAKVSRGKAFVIDVMEKSAKNIATQATTYAIGTMVNKVAGSNIVNPKKGQKDK